MSLFITYLVSGLTIGCVYALLTLSVTVVSRGSRTINFAQGEFAMFSAFICWALSSVGVPLLLAVAAAIAFGFAIGAATQLMLMRPLAGKSPQARLLVSIGLYLGVNSLVGVIWSTDPRAAPSIFPSDLSKDFVELDGARIYDSSIGLVVLLILVSAIVAVLVRYTSFGLGMRAVAANPESARLAGIRVVRVNALTWGLAGAVGAIAGVALASTTTLSSQLMTEVFIYALAAATLGGLDSLLGAVVAAVLVGVATELIADYVTWVGQSLKQTLVLALIVVVLLVRPAGLSGTRKVVRA